MKFKKIALFLALASSLGLGSQALAHDIWVAKTHGEQAINYGHGVNTDAYPARKVQQAYGYKTDGSRFEIEKKDRGNHVELLANDAAMIVTVFDNGYYAQNKEGKWINKRGDQVEGATSSNRYVKESVSYQNPRVKPVKTGLTLEIVPSFNPSSLKEGDSLRVQVLFEGKPVADAEVKSNQFDPKSPKVKTDKDGYATVKVATSVFNILAVGHAVESDDPFDGKQFSSTLTFKAKRDKKEH